MQNPSSIRSVQSRTRALMVMIFTAISLCIFSYWFVQIVRGNQFKEEAENNQFHTRRIPAPRGKIFDRSGEVILVNNRPAFNLYIVPERSDDLEADIRALSDRLHLSEEDITQILEKVKLRRSFQPLLVKEDIDFEQMAYFSSRANIYPELTIEVKQKRFYPYDSFASHILGRVGEVTPSQLKTEKFGALQPGAMAGQSGLEYQYQHLLAGSDGEMQEIRNSHGRVMRENINTYPEQGEDIVLTIDYELQAKAEELFAEESGALVAISVVTGEVITLVSSPGYDPNEYQDQFASLIKDEESPLLNRATSGQFSPGSVWKPLMASAGLREGLIEPGERVFCAQSVLLAGRLWNDNAFHGNVDVAQALTKSSNVFFYKLGNRLGIDRILKWSNRFGFGHRSGIDLPNEKPGLIPDPETMPQRHGRPWYPADTINLSIGQGDLLVTPLQMAVYMGAIANDGYLVQPRLLRGVYASDGEIAPAESSPRVNIGVESETLEAVRKGLWGVVNNAGTATRARIPQISVAGKTGTAQVAARKYWREDMPRELRHHVWFVCFAPYENPEIAVAVFVEHGMNSSRVAVPIAAEYLRAYARARERLNLPGSRGDGS